MDRETIISALNEDLSAELQAITMYIQYSAKIQGPWRTELRQFFQTEVQDELRHAQFLADKIAVLGGEPTTTARPVPRADTAQEMLQAILQAELEAIRGYNERVKQAEEFGDTALKVQLENQILDETGHKEEVEQQLARWPVSQ